MPIRRERLLALLLPLAAPAWAADSDGDHVDDSADQCPQAMEDQDGDRDWDGCPDKPTPLDIDGDGVLNVMDRCPTVPGGHGGCASRLASLQQVGDTRGKAGDSDGDGVADAVDRCRMGIEDVDGDRDLDGCPDVVTSADRDGDTVPDMLDQCPDLPGGETGCPPKFRAVKKAPSAKVTPAVKLAHPSQMHQAPAAGSHAPPTDHASWPVIRHRHTHACHGHLVESSLTSDWFFKCDSGELVRLHLSGGEMPAGVKVGTRGTVHYNPKFSAPMEWNLGWIDVDGGGQIVPNRSGEGCFVTTATLRALPELDDGPTLSLLRTFRDEILRANPAWSELVDAYYAMSPALVRQIDGRVDAQQIYRVLYEDYLAHIVCSVRQGHHHCAVKEYRRMVHDLSLVAAI